MKNKMVYTDKLVKTLPANGGVIPNVILDYELKKFAEKIVPHIIEMIQIKKEYPTDKDQEVELSLNVRLEENFDLSKVVNVKSND